MHFNKAVKNINRSLIRKKPSTFDRIWIKKNLRSTYFFIVENIKDEFGETDWDLVVSSLDRHLSRLWLKGVKRNHAAISAYVNEKEADTILKKYRHKLYVFLAQAKKGDKQLCDLISIKLVRVAQKGNMAAQQKAMTLIGHVVEQWIEDLKLPRWRGYDDLIRINMEGCIRRFRYAGSFLGYLYRTLEYSGRGLKPLELFSLDDCLSSSIRKRADSVVYDNETGLASMFRKHRS